MYLLVDAGGGGLHFAGVLGFCSSGGEMTQPFETLRDNVSLIKSSDDFLKALKQVRESGEVTQRTREWIERVERIRGDDLHFIVDCRS